MTVLEWSDALAVGIAFMDEDHHHAVELINDIGAGGDVVAAFAAYLAHCEEHFGREDDLMRQTGFFAIGPHGGEHARVLDEMRATLAEMQAGQSVDRAALARDQAEWLLGHRNSMDLVTAQFARAQGRE